MTSQELSQSDGAANRFSELINPIRDLALNWDVDIAHTLEDYLEELDQIRLPAHLLPKGGGRGEGNNSLQNLNFAEAALLIQGSTCVYSKKVEYLHNLVFQALELISASKEGEKKDKHGNPVMLGASEDDSFLWGDDPSFLLLDDMVVLSAANIDLIQAPNDSDRFSSHKNGRRKSNGRLSLASDISRTSRSSIILMNSILHDDHSFGSGSNGGGATSNSLKMASCAMNSEGALVFANSSVEHSTGPSRSSRLSFAQGGGDRGGDSGMMLNVSNNDNDDDYLGGGDGGGYSDDDVGDNEWNVGDQRDSGQVERQEGQNKSSTGGINTNSPSNDPSLLLSMNDAPQPSVTPIFNPIALLDPYELDDGVSLGVSRAVKTDRRTFRIPSSTPHDNLTSFTKDTTTTAGGLKKQRNSSTNKITSLFDFNMVMSSYKSSASLSPAIALSTAAVCKPSNLLKVGTSFQQVLSKRSKIQNQFHAEYYQESVLAKVGSREKTIQYQNVVERENRSDDILDGGDDVYYYGGEEEDYNAPDFGGPDYDDDFDLDANDVGYALPRLSVGGNTKISNGVDDYLLGGEEALLARRVEGALNDALGQQSTGIMGDGSSHLSAYSEYSNTFENLCRQHISNFMRGAEDYARETNLSRRVNAWTMRLEPLLVEQETRPAFDIHVYSDKALSVVANKVNEKTGGLDHHKTTSNKTEDYENEISDELHSVNFSDVVGGESNFEVCRTFLACLQLANLGNISFTQASLRDPTASKKDETSRGNSRKNKNSAPSSPILTFRKCTRDISDFTVHLLDDASNRLKIDAYRAPSVMEDSDPSA